MKGPRYAHSACWIAWVFGSVAIAGTLIAPFLIVRASDRFDVVDIVNSAGFIIVFALFGGLGILLATRRPDNPIGPMFALAGAFMNAGVIVGIYAEAGLPGRTWATWLTEWLPLLAIPLIPLILLVFPDGTLLSRRWRFVAWAAAVSGPWLAIGTAITPGDMADTGVVNPVGVEAIGGQGLLAEGGVGWLLLLLAFVGSAISLMLRFRRSRGLQRQQMKGLALAASLLGGGWVAVSSFYAMLGDAVYLIMVPAFAALPVATALAILKYRLYDIDVIINRTLVYGALTVVLALVYVAGVVGVGGLVRGMTGQERNNVVVAASTLVTAGLFRPARTRIQAFIDRRFYRSTYDAQQTIADFSAKMRNQIDLDSLTSEMVAVVRKSVHPTHVSLWLRS
jgi:hypothetical protein